VPGCWGAGLSGGHNIQKIIPSLKRNIEFLGGFADFREKQGIFLGKLWKKDFTKANK
jgi:hypothetical protein